MGRGAPKLMEDFLFPHLNNETFGKYLKWENEELKIFRLLWNHRSGSKWSPMDTAVFKAWDKLKGRDGTGEKDSEMASKQRFRAAMNKVETLKQLPSLDKDIKRCQIISVSKKKPNRSRDQELPLGGPNSPDAETLYCTQETYSHENFHVGLQSGSEIPRLENSISVEQQPAFESEKSYYDLQCMNPSGCMPIQNPFYKEQSLKIFPVTEESRILQNFDIIGSNVEIDSMVAENEIPDEVVQPLPMEQPFVAEDSGYLEHMIPLQNNTSDEEESVALKDMDEWFENGGFNLSRN